MKRFFFEYSNYSPLKQFILAFVLVAVISLAIDGSQAIEPTLVGFALSFGPSILLGALFVLVIRFVRPNLKG